MAEEASTFFSYYDYVPLLQKRQNIQAGKIDSFLLWTDKFDISSHFIFHPRNNNRFLAK